MANTGYKVNEDGSVTKINSGGSSNGGRNNNNSGGSSDNSGCGWIIGIAVVIGIIFGIVGETGAYWDSMEGLKQRKIIGNCLKSYC